MASADAFAEDWDWRAGDVARDARRVHPEEAARGRRLQERLSSEERERLKHFEEYDFVRFLRAREGDLDASEALLRGYLAWRAAFGADFGYAERGGVPASLVQADVASGKAYIFGRDKLQRPCVYTHACRHDASADPRDVERFTVYMLDSLEHAVRQGPTQQYVAIVDYAHYSRRNFDTHNSKFILHVMSDIYPERLGALYLVNCGWLFWILWKLVQPFMPARTRRKIHMLGADYRYGPEQRRAGAWGRQRVGACDRPPRTHLVTSRERQDGAGRAIRAAGAARGLRRAGGARRRDPGGHDGGDERGQGPRSKI